MKRLLLILALVAAFCLSASNASAIHRHRYYAYYAPGCGYAVAPVYRYKVKAYYPGYGYYRAVGYGVPGWGLGYPGYPGYSFGYGGGVGGVGLGYW